jgi:hypothetical protein
MVIPTDGAVVDTSLNDVAREIARSKSAELQILEILRVCAERGMGPARLSAGLIALLIGKEILSPMDVARLLQGTETAKPDA